MKNLIECDDLKLGYEGYTVLENLSFAVEERDYLCIIGNNGTGKSTLVKALLGLKKPLKGKIHFRNGLMRNEVGYLAQQSSIQKDFPASVEEVILSGCANSRGLRPFYTASEKRKVQENMELLEIGDLSKKCFRELSGGQQQRVLLARALCASAKLLLLDEPTTGLDPQMTTSFFETIQKLNRENGIAVIMVTHDTHCAAKFSNHILHLYDKTGFYSSTQSYIRTKLGQAYMGGHRHD